MKHNVLVNNVYTQVKRSGCQACVQALCTWLAWQLSTLWVSVNRYNSLSPLTTYVSLSLSCTSSQAPFHTLQQTGNCSPETSNFLPLNILVTLLEKLKAQRILWPSKYARMRFRPILHPGPSLTSAVDTRRVSLRGALPSQIFSSITAPASLYCPKYNINNRALQMCGDNSSVYSLEEEMGGWPLMLVGGWDNYDYCYVTDPRKIIYGLLPSHVVLCSACGLTHWTRSLADVKSDLEIGGVAPWSGCHQAAATDRTCVFVAVTLYKLHLDNQ